MQHTRITKPVKQISQSRKVAPNMSQDPKIKPEATKPANIRLAFGPQAELILERLSLCHTAVRQHRSRDQCNRAKAKYKTPVHDEAPHMPMSIN